MLIIRGLSDLAAPNVVRPMNISLRQMRAFSAVARAGSFTAGARQINLTQSAVSMLVQQLEDELGVQLFDRGRTAITLTEAGQQLLPLARRMLDDLTQLVDGASDLRSLRTGILRVVAPQMLTCTWIAAVLGEFEGAHPDIGLRVMDATTDDVVGTVRRGDVELGIGPERPTGDDVTRSFLMSERALHYLERVALADRRAVSWDELRDERWVIYSSEFNRHLERILHAHDASLSMQTAAEVGYLTTALALVGVGMGLAAVPDYARLFAGNFGLKFVPMHGPDIRRQFFIYQRRGMALSPAAQAFVAMMRRHAETKIDSAESA